MGDDLESFRLKSFQIVDFRLEIYGTTKSVDLKSPNW